MSDTFYGRFVKEMFKSRPNSDEDLNDIYALLHAASGVAGEAGEIVDLIKKTAFTGKNLYTDEIIKEMGDLEFYLEALRQSLHITRDEILNANWRKLSARHGDNNIEDYYAE